MQQVLDTNHIQISFYEQAQVYISSFLSRCSTCNWSSKHELLRALQPTLVITANKRFKVLWSLH